MHGPDHLHVNVQRRPIGQRKEMVDVAFRIWRTSRITRRDSRKDIGHSSAWETKRSGMELSLTHLKENEFHSQSDGGKIQRHRSPSIQEYQRFKSWNSEKKEWQRTPHTSMRMLRTQSSCSKSFIEISSVFTEQFRNRCELFGLTEEEMTRKTKRIRD